MKLAIIGGGAAGMMAGATLIEKKVKAEVHLFEKNTLLGRKVVISGGGRCNVTTGITDKNLLLTKYIRGSKFLVPALSAFPPQKVMAWFGEHGTPLKTEEDNRVFPVSNKGEDIATVFTEIFSQNDVRMHLGESVKSLLPKGQGFSLTTAKAEYDFDAVIITSGGNAYRHTGSSGDGYDFAKACGHTITGLGPSLNSFETQEVWPKKLSGVSLLNVKLEAIVEGGSKKSFTGPFLFTHFGISGPAVFGISAHLAFNKITPAVPVKLTLYPDADLNFEKWDERLRQLFEAHGSAQVHNTLAEILPRRLIDELLALASLSRIKKCAKVSKEERRALVHLLSGQLHLTLINRRQGEEFVTAGGVNLDEVDSKTMRSKLNPNLYFAGEVLDVDGVTGGFNLQAAWATGRLAGGAKL